MYSCGSIHLQFTIQGSLVYVLLWKYPFAVHVTRQFGICTPVEASICSSRYKAVWYMYSCGSIHLLFTLQGSLVYVLLWKYPFAVHVSRQVGICTPVEVSICSSRYKAVWYMYSCGSIHLQFTLQGSLVYVLLWKYPFAVHVTRQFGICTPVVVSIAWLRFPHSSFMTLNCAHIGKDLFWHIG
jgi:hypothetical protein